MAKTRLAFVVLVALVGAVCAHTVARPEAPAIKFINGDIDTSDALSALTSFGAFQMEDTSKYTFLVQFAAPFNTENVKTLQSRISGHLFGYAPDNAVFLYATAFEAASLLEKGQDLGVTWVGELPKHVKEHPTVRTPEDAPAQLASGATSVLAHLRTLAGGDAPALAHLRILAVPTLTTADLKAISQGWASGLPAAATVAVSSGQIAVVSVPVGDIAATSAFLVAQPEVLVVERRYASRISNRFAHGVIQADDEDHTPLWDAGLTGKGQLVGIGDSGIDYNRCSFVDTVGPAFVQTPNDKVEDKGHRKIKAYWSMMDAIDANVGHGTHVTGTVAGNAAADAPGKEELAKYNGGAFDARVVFTDIGCQTENGCVCKSEAWCTARCPLQDVAGEQKRVCGDSERETWEPDDLNANFFGWSRAQGARIHSNSWGEGTGPDNFSYYKVQTHAIDQFAWDNKDFLILFAAGNSGDSNGFYSLDPEATSKNAITVAASQTTNNGYVAVAEHLTDYAKKMATAKDLCAKAKVDCPFLDSQDAVCAAAAATPLSAGCQALKGTAMFGCDDLCKTTAVAKVKADTVSYNKENLAYFTSLGLTRDGRIKPDVAAPGYNIISTAGSDPKAPTKCGANADPWKELTAKSGTSMATPNTAGNAVLVRQYFIEGFYPDGVKTPTRGFSPSASLMKAVLINSGKQLNGVIKVGAQFHPLSQNPGTIPSQYQPPFMSVNHGWGRVTLNNTLPLKGSDSCLALALATDGGEDAVLKETGGTYQRCFTAAAGTPLKFTLVYTDYPSVPSVSSHLVNDLDLKVASEPSGSELFGNHLVAVRDDGTFAPIPDRRNNVEQVYIKTPQAGTYCVAVSAHRIVHGPQPFALAVTGCNVKAVDRSTVV